jgi:hypothetical protein
VSRITFKKIDATTRGGLGRAIYLHLFGWMVAAGFWTGSRRRFAIRRYVGIFDINFAHRLTIGARSQEWLDNTAWANKRQYACNPWGGLRHPRTSRRMIST